MVRILQFSDLHYREALPGHSGHSERLSRHGRALLARLAKRIEIEKPDLVAFTGDIIDAPHDLLHGTGDPQDRTQLTEYLRRDYATMRVWLESLGRPWMIAPGNHDYRPVFLEIFGDAPREMNLLGMRAIAYSDWEVCDNTSERLDEQMNRFEAAVEHADPEGWVVHFQHFLIWPMVEHGYPMRYRTADALRDRLAEAKARHLVMCGHFHEGTDVVTLGNARFAVCPSMTEAPHRYRVFDLWPDGSLEMREERLAPGPVVDRPLLLIDRTEIVTDEPDIPTAAFSLYENSIAVFRRARAAGFAPILVSAWNDPQSLYASWAEIMKRHDRMFTELSRVGADQGEGLVICIDEFRPEPTGLPSEKLSRYGTLRQRVSDQFGIGVDRIWFLSADPKRRACFGGESTIADIRALPISGAQIKEAQS